MSKVCTAFIVLVLLAGCQTAYPGRSRYHGVDSKLFFLEWGAPVAQHRRKLPGMEYLWISRRDSAYKPGRADTDLIGNTAWWRGYKKKWFNPLLECRVRIITDAHGYIEEIRVAHASAGWWDFPRCREVFGPPIR